MQQSEQFTPKTIYYKQSFVKNKKSNSSQNLIAEIHSKDDISVRTFKKFNFQMPNPNKDKQSNSQLSLKNLIGLKITPNSTSQNAFYQSYANCRFVQFIKISKLDGQIIFNEINQKNTQRAEQEFKSPNHTRKGTVDNNFTCRAIAISTAETQQLSTKQSQSSVRKLKIMERNPHRTLKSSIYQRAQTIPSCEDVINPSFQTKMNMLHNNYFIKKVNNLVKTPAEKYDHSRKSYIINNLDVKIISKSHVLENPLYYTELKKIKTPVTEKQNNQFVQFYQKIANTLGSIDKASHNDGYKQIYNKYDLDQIKYRSVLDTNNVSKALQQMLINSRKEMVEDKFAQSYGEIPEAEKVRILMASQKDRMQIHQLQQEFKKQTSMQHQNQVVNPSFKNDIFLTSKKNRQQRNLFEGLATMKQFTGITAKKRQAVVQSLLQEFIKYIELGLTLQDVYKNEVFVWKPYFRQNSKRFFEAVKQNDLNEIDKMLLKDKYLVYDIDINFMSPLHHSVQRNNMDLTKYLLHKKACIDMKDRFGRTPLFYAARNENHEIFRFLIMKKAQPYTTGKQSDFNRYISKSGTGYECDGQFLKVSKKIHMRMNMGSWKDRGAVWNESKYLLECLIN